MPRPKTYQISIPQPCHESWDNMTASEKGRFCNSCQKHVIDFTQLSDKEIIKLIEESSGRMCGRVKRSQMERPIYIEKYNKIFFPMKAQIIGSLFALASIHPIISSAAKNMAVECTVWVDEPTPTAQPTKPNPPDGDTTKYTLKGIVQSESKVPLGGTLLFVEETKESVLTDENGEFTISVTLGQHVQVKAIGYENQTIVVDKKMLNKDFPFQVTMLEGAWLGLIVITKEDITNSAKNIIYNPSEAQLNFYLNTNR